MNYFNTNKEYTQYINRVKQEFSVSEVPAGYLFYILNIDGTSASVVSRKDFFENIKNKITVFLEKNPDSTLNEIINYIRADIYEEYKSNILVSRYVTIILNALICENKIELHSFRRKTLVNLI